ncbi:MAG: hypothetical protein JXQ75_22415 [Phycisphaerae bacterium]|nr:hypothetical protein [Phycisphaerae bacterium]
MSDPPQVILLDSNAYLRLARSIHPLLHGSFGDNPTYSLFVLADLDDEYASSPRLRTKFEWVREAKYIADREHNRYTPAGKIRARVDNAFSFLARYARTERLNVSPEDLKALAVGFARGIPVVSDDHDMAEMARVHDIERWPTIKLLKLMVATGRIDMAKVVEVLEYLDHENDLPTSKSDLRKQFREYFQTDCPI